MKEHHRTRCTLPPTPMLHYYENGRRRALVAGIYHRLSSSGGHALFGGSSLLCVGKHRLAHTATWFGEIIMTPLYTPCRAAGHACSSQLPPRCSALAIHLPLPQMSRRTQPLQHALPLPCTSALPLPPYRAAGNAASPRRRCIAPRLCASTAFHAFIPAFCATHAWPRRCLAELQQPIFWSLQVRG